MEGIKKNMDYQMSRLYVHLHTSQLSHTQTHTSVQNIFTGSQKPVCPPFSSVVLEVAACSQSLPRNILPSQSPNHPCREEKTEQLADTRHEVDQLVLELQKAKQDVSTRPGPARPWAESGVPQ